MSRPPVQTVKIQRVKVQTVKEPWDRILWLPMSEKAPKKFSSKHLEKAAAAIFLIAALALLSGCQGVSAGGPPSTSVGTLSLQNASVAFGSVTTGSSKTLTVSATNSGSASVSITAITISTNVFSLTSTLPVTLAAGQSTPISVKFAPTATGIFSATLSITSNASDSLMQVALTGTGTGASGSPGLLALNPTGQPFGSVHVGSQVQDTVTLSNTGGSSVDISQISITGTGFQFSGIAAPLTLTSGQSTSFTLTFAPEATGSVLGDLTITSDGSNPTLTMKLSGDGIAPGPLGSDPTTLAFGSVTVGSNQSISETVTNTGSTTITISNVAISGTGFSLSGITAPVVLPGGGTATFSVEFAPTAAGSASGDVTVTSTATNPTLTIPLSGTGASGAGTLADSPATLAIGSVVVGTSGEGSGSLTASGASVKITAASTNNSAFTISGLSLPVTITAGNSVPYTVTFSPEATGSASATLTFTSNAQPATTTETLTGTGTAAPTHSVNLSWTASTSPDISGYNIYRAVYTSSCGTYAKINPQLNTTTLYTDSNVTDGTAYCYAATAVNTSEEESGYSNIVSNVQIPAP